MPLVIKVQRRTWLLEQQRQEGSEGHQASYEEDGQGEAAGLLVQLPDAKVTQERRKRPQHLDQRKACANHTPSLPGPVCLTTQLAHAFLASFRQWALAQDQASDNRALSGVPRDPESTLPPSGQEGGRRI